MWAFLWGRLSRDRWLPSAPSVPGLSRSTQLTAANQDLEATIEEYQQTQDQLQHLQQRLQSLMSASPAIIFASQPFEPYSVTFISDNVATITGHAPSSFLKDADFWIDRIYPEDLSNILENLPRLFERGMHSHEYRWQYRDRHYYWMRSELRLVREADGTPKEIIGHWIDISDRKQAELELTHNRDLREAFFHESTDAIFLVDAETLLTLDCNRRAVELFEASRKADLIGIEGHMLQKYQFTADEMAAIVHDVRTQGFWSREIEYISFRGKHFWGSLAARQITVARRTLNLVRVTDISARKHAEMSLRQANLKLQAEIAERLEAERRLEQIAVDLKRSNQDLEQFAYVASHDLQEPLRTITSYTQLLAKRYKDQLDDRANRYIDYAVDGATRMQQLIRDLLAYSRVGRHETALQAVDCNAVVNRVLQNLEFAIAENQATIHCPDLPTLMAEPNQLSLLFQNLIGNAIKYRSEAPPEIKIAVHEQDDHWVFTVQDNGIGIEFPYLERIFGIFQRLHTSDEYQGTGLGLAICKKIVEQYGGQIWAESQFSNGSTFYFTLPRWEK